MGICASQLVDAGVTWVIIGHSERREGFGMAGEDNELIAKKVKVAVDAGLKVMFCIGEKKEEREKGVTLQVCEEQMKPAVELLEEEDYQGVGSIVSKVRKLWNVASSYCKILCVV